MARHSSIPPPSSLPWLALVLLVPLSCSTPPQQDQQAKRAKPGASLEASPTEAPTSSLPPPAPTESTAPLLIDPAPLSELIRLALEQRPELDAAQRELAARLAEARQAGRRVNPHLQLELEDFAGSGQRSRLGGAQSTLFLAQEFELGGKRSAREELARVEAQLADREGGMLVREVIAQTTQAFWRALQAQGELELARSIEETTRGFLEAVRERVSAGKVSPVEEAKYAVSLATASLERRDAERASELARRALERSVGGEVRIARLEGGFHAATQPPPLEELRRLLTQGPRFAGLDLDEERAQAELELAGAQRVVDLELSLGLRRFELTDDYAAVVGLDLPLPVFDRKRDAQEAARERRRGAKAIRGARELELHSALEGAWSRLAGAHADLRAMEDGVLRDSAWVSSAVDEGYREGKFELLDALDAQRTLFEVRARHLRALADYHLALTEIEWLLCRTLDS